MKRFSFSLDRVLAWRRLQREQEQAALEKLIAERNALAERVRQIRTDRAECRDALAHSLTLESRQVTTLPGWLAKVTNTLHSLAARSQELEGRVQRQQETLREAERQVKLLERLRDRRLTVWQTQVALEEEAFAAEAYLARCIRLKKANPTGA